MASSRKRTLSTKELDSIVQHLNEDDTESSLSDFSDSSDEYNPEFNGESRSSNDSDGYYSEPVVSCSESSKFFVLLIFQQK